MPEAKPTGNYQCLPQWGKGDREAVDEVYYRIRKAAGGAMPFVANGIAPPLPRDWLLRGGCGVPFQKRRDDIFPYGIGVISASVEVPKA